MNHQQHLLLNGNTLNGGTLGNIQSVQQFLISNNMTQNGEIPHQNVQVQILKQEQAQQRYLINRQYMTQLQNQQLQVQVQEPPYYVLAEMDSDNDLNSYVMVESKDIVGRPVLSDVTTAKSIQIDIDGNKHNASVIISSADKNFVHKEYQQLKALSEENLRRKEKTRDTQVRKRRRLSGSEMARTDDESSLSGWSNVSQSANVERVLSPSVHLQPKIIYKSEQIKPMSFDQGTQTDPKLSGTAGGLTDKIQELQRLVELNEMILNEQKSLKNEVKANRLFVESFAGEFSSLRKDMQQIQSKLESMSERPQFDMVTATPTSTKKKILNGSGTQAGSYFIIESQDGSASENTSILNGSNLEYTVEELVHDENSRASRMSYHDQASMASNTSLEFVAPKKEIFGRNSSSSSFSQHSASSTPISRANSNSSLTEEWSEGDGEVVIGSNGTKVPVHILRAIDWKSYKTATRKLLIALFTRDILATKSLTGRPSPAFHDRNKPIKGKLDQNIVNDIIQIVTRKCNTSDGLVRQAITTKCADENKMLRNRNSQAEEKFKTPTSSSNGPKVRNDSGSAKSENSNKENVIINVN